jgi:glycerol-3-phosphate dehydrogenase
VIERSQALAALSRSEFDIVVVGGGITGAGVALDAASRGYSVALLERADFASGTSSRSSKLVHGGLRYLQNFDLGLVREALLERQLMVALAPHLVRPLPLVVPAFEGARPDRLLGVGLNLYDVMSVDRDRLRTGRSAIGRGRRARAERGMPVEDELPMRLEENTLTGTGESWSPERHRTISGEEVLELLPALAAREPTSGYLFYDCQTDDVRLVLTVLGEAERFGAVCANRMEVTGLLERDGLTLGVRATDSETGELFEVRAANVVNATGVWADRLRPQELHDEAELPRIRPSRGTHVTLRHEDLPLVGGAIVPAGAGRTIFALPWLGRTLIGTTDNDYEGPLEHVAPAAEDVDYLLTAVNEFFASTLTPADLTGAYAGVRPLISTGDPKKSVDISRKAELYETSSGMITITGGKLTTWRRMAKLAVDRLVEREARKAPCRTHEIPLGQAIAAEELPRVEGVGEESYQALAARYGHGAKEALALAAERGELAQPIVDGLPDLLAEVALAARREQARSIGDVLLRRTRLGLLAANDLLPDRAGEASAAVRRVADVLARELGWSAERAAEEIRRFAQEARAEGSLDHGGGEGGSVAQREGASVGLSVAQRQGAAGGPSPQQEAGAAQGSARAEDAARSSAPEARTEEIESA